MNKSIALSVLALVSMSLLALTGAANAGQNSVEKRQKDTGMMAAASAICKTFTGAPKVSINQEGNIVVFQGSNQGDHMYNEGYTLCNTGSPARYSNSFGDSGFGAASCNCVGNTCKVTRITADGKMSLVQELSKPTTLDRSFNIKMTVKNLTGGNINSVILRRLATVDINSAIDEWHDATRDSVSAWGTKADAIPFAVKLRHITKRPTTTVSEAKVVSFNNTSCNPPDQAIAGPVFGDFDSTVQYNLGTLGPNASKSVSVQYLRD